MRIGIVRQRYAAFGGAERYLTSLAVALAKQGHDMHLFAHRWDQTAGITFHPVGMLRWPGFLRALSFAHQTRRILAYANMDLVFSLERTLQQDIYRAGDGCHREWLRLRGCFLPAWKRLLLRINPLHRALLWIERRTFDRRHTGWIIANSHRVKNEIIHHYQYPADRITVIHNGVDTDKFKPLPQQRSPDQFILLFVGSGFERKGLHFAIRALPYLPSNVRLRVVGRDNFRPYHALAKHLRIADRVDFLGPVAISSDVYAQANLLIHPAIYEPFSNACMEAFACGLPVVTTRVNGVAEIIQPGVNGAIVDDPSDSSALGSAIRPFLDRAIWERASKEARLTAEAHSFALHLQATLAVLNQSVTIPR